tara:strand:- start:112069 stop:112863 length:795 start_codon:yes stop_codon:yes gene_type:complete
MRHLIFLLIIGSSITANSQFGIAPTVSYGVSFKSHESFNNFANSYNSVIQDIPAYKEDLNSWGAGRNFEVGLGVAMFGFLMHELNYSRITHNSNVDFQYDHRRKFKMTQNEFNYLATFGGFSEGAQLTFGAGISLISSKIRSSYVFSDGYESLGEDGRLNGIYTLTTVKPILGARFSYPLKKGISITARADWLMPFGTDSKKYGAISSFTDLNRSKVNGSYFSYEQLPQEYNPSQTSIQQNEPTVNGDWQEFRLRIGIIFLLVE